MTTKIDPQLYSEMERIARLVGKRARKFGAESDDFQNQAWEWMLTHMHRLTRARMKDGRLFEQAFVETLDAVAKKHIATHEKRSDAFRWTREALASALDGKWAPATFPLPEGRRIMPASLERAEDYVARVATGRADVDKAVNRLDLEGRALIFRRYVAGQPTRLIAEQTNLTVGQVDGRLRLAETRVLEYLNATDERPGPWGGPGHRRALSNAGVAALMAEQESGESEAA